MRNPRNPFARDINAGEAYTGRVNLGARQMNLTVHIPDEIAGSLSAGGDLSRRVLEGFAIEEFKSERISKAQLRRLLGFDPCSTNSTTF